MRFAPWPSNTLALYEARLFALRILGFAFVLIGLLQVLDLLSESEKILAAPGNDNGDLLRYVSLRIPQLADTFLPFSVLLGALLTWSSLNQSSEITIMRGAGMSPHAILFPLTATAMLVAVFHFWFSETVLPETNRQLDAWQQADYGEFDPDRPDDRVDVWQTGETDVLYAGRVIGEGADTVLEEVEVYRRGGGRLDAQFTAMRAYPAEGGWRLEGAERFDVGRGALLEVDSPVVGSGIPPERYDLRIPDPDEVNSRTLAASIETLEATGLSTDGLRTSLHQKFVKPLSALLMPLLGAVAGFGLARSGQLFMRTVVGLALGFAYFVADNAMLAMGEFGAAPPLLAAWGPFLLFLLVGEAMIFRTEE
ncbi:LPS export ABC transporter permease LptG [Pacificimonas flava]|uniref:LPS export ABC transporter permease LptG n=2 Tax=Pacificimonas TaxID=1960290 RepID=A0A219B1S1_9SPHN|nr:MULTISPECIES: LPS export ABC transporter permease LptG [Pacificimonas]MBZ6378327.1 LPS export ABC transporter permease LptG [Pacificimonas aurantium]OWV32066.1 LPS export ABC transporter permease LptG [Pacificimonas flava]